MDFMKKVTKGVFYSTSANKIFTIHSFHTRVLLLQKCPFNTDYDIDNFYHIFHIESKNYELKYAHLFVLNDMLMII